MVRDLEALARALESPLDRVAWLAVLRAPFVGLSLPDLTAVSEAAGDGTDPRRACCGEIPGLSPDGVERLLRAKPLLLAAWHEREREPRAHLVERVWLALGGAFGLRAAERARACAPVPRGARRRRPQAPARPAARSRAAHGPLCTRKIQRSTTPDAVSLMTIHGAKGLEFDHVFVVGVGLRGRGDDPRLLNWLEMPREQGGDHLLMAPIRVRDEDDEVARMTRSIPIIELLHRERARAERSRQAYVALTRARRSLHLFVHPRDEARPTANSNSAPMRAPCCTTSGRPSAAMLADLSEPRRTRMRIVEARPARGHPDAPATACGASFTAGAAGRCAGARRARAARRGPGRNRIQLGAPDRAARRHRGARSAGAIRARRLPALRMNCRACARGWNRGCRRSASRRRARATGAERALTALRATLDDARGRWLFDPAHREAHSELALSGVRGAPDHQRGDRSHLRRGGRHPLGGGLQDQPARRRRPGGVPRRGSDALHGAACALRAPGARSWDRSRCAPACTSRCWRRGAKSTSASKNLRS